MKDSELLRRVHSKVRTYNHIFICRAIDSIRAPMEQKQSLIQWVMQMLAGYYTYNDWLRYQHPKRYAKMRLGDFKYARLAWLDWMIAYCEKEEAK
jgi:hypothetical protein